ncbi:MAG: hypothetical protein ABIT38_02820 [Gemmatimonadaceae bacterium]
MMPPSRPLSARFNRRAMLGFAASTAATVVVSQTLAACSASDVTGTATTPTSDPSTSTSRVLTAMLTEGPYFVDEKLEARRATSSRRSSFSTKP